jgi:hypothetical protein
MCAEAVLWRCHRSLIADVLIARGIAVREIVSGVQTRPHSLTQRAQVTAQRLRILERRWLRDDERPLGRGLSLVASCRAERQDRTCRLTHNVLRRRTKK